MTASLLEQLADLPKAEVDALIRAMAPGEANAFEYDWRYRARPEQLPPDGPWRVWLLMAGRGFGKTRCGAEWVRAEVKAGRRRIALVGPTAADARNGMRLGADPRTVVTTTPRPAKLIRDLVRDPICVVTRGTSYENRGNLAPVFFDQIIRKYQGTRLGGQELNAQLLEDTPGALWSHGSIEASRLRLAPEMTRVVVTTVRGSAPSRIPNISMSQASG